jgi:uncharacterized protein (TIGR02231 family)
MTKLATIISAATVYPDRVRLTRHGSIRLEHGTHSLELQELPLGIDPDTLRATVYGSTMARLLGVEMRRIFYTDQPTDRVRILEEEIEKLQDNLKRLEAKLELIKHNRATLDDLAGQVSTYATAFAAGEMNVEQQLEYFEKLRAKCEKLNDETVRIQAEERKTKHQLDRLTKELDQMRNAVPRERYTARINIEVEEESDLTIEVSYTMSGAGWKPLYDLRLLEKEGNPTLEVTYLADVTQNSEETWEEVALTLSTARPTTTSTMPELETWYIHPPEPIYPAVRLGMAVQAAAAPGEKPHGLGMPAELTQPEEKAQVVTAQVNTSDASVSYLIPIPVSIPPDGSPHKVMIARFPLTPVLDYVSTPKLTQAVFRRAKVENDSPYTLLPGEANILIIDEYVGTTQLELTVSGEVTELYLGSDNRVKVQREMRRREVDKRSISPRRNQVFGYEIKLESMLPSKANLTVYDQIPVSRNEDIKVRLESVDPKPTELTELNQLEWKLLLEPKEQRTLRFDFSVESPQNIKVIGLP